MKKLFIAAGLALSGLAMNAANGYHVTGTAAGVEEGDTVLLCEMQGFFSMVPLDTTTVKNGKFVFSGDFDGAATRFILPIHNGKNTAMADFLLENADIDLTISDDPKVRPIVKTEGAANKLQKEYDALMAPYDKEMEKPWSIVTDSVSSKEDKAKARAIVDSISDIKKSLTKVFTVAHIPSAYSDYLYVMNGRTFSEPERDIIEKKMEEGHHYYYFQQMLDEKKAEMAAAVGQQYTDLAMPNPKGKTIRVSDYVKKNKYTLIDFWASWCGPCRAEMPTVVKAYNLYHKKGFEVVGVSFDNNKAAWVKAIAQLKLSWPHMSDLKGWECAASSVYNVKGIPANVLVDSQGTIVAKNLRGENLLNELAKLMK